MCENQFDNLIIKRRKNISNTLTRYFPKELAELISNYDYYFEGKSYSLKIPSKCQGHSSIRSIIVLPGGRIANESFDNKINIWNSLNGIHESTFSGDFCTRYCNSVLPDGRMVGYSIDNMTLKIWNPFTGNIDNTFSGHKNMIYCCVVLPDFPNRIVTGSWDHTLKVWNSITGRCDISFEEHSNVITCIAIILFKDEDYRIVSGSCDGLIKMWNPQNGKCDMTFVGNHVRFSVSTYSVNKIIIGSDGTKIIAGYENGVVRIWNASTGKCDTIFIDDNYPVKHLAIIPDGRIVSGLVSRNILKIWNAQTGGCESILKHSGIVKCVAVLPDGRIITGSSDCRINIWDPFGSAEQPVGSVEQPVGSVEQPVGSLASPRQPQTGNRDFISDYCDINYITVLPDGRIATDSYYNTVEIWC
jgi:WD40 repeat protein